MVNSFERHAFFRLRDLTNGLDLVQTERSMEFTFFGVRS